MKRHLVCDRKESFIKSNRLGLCLVMFCVNRLLFFKDCMALGYRNSVGFLSAGVNHMRNK